MPLRQEHSTRHMILHLIKTEGSMSVGDLSERLGITEMAVRRHIHALERDGYVASRLVRRTMGRPQHRYELTPGADELFPRTYHALALDLLEELEEVGVSADELFELRRERLARRHAPAMDGQPLPDKVARLADIQNSAGYMASWERERDGYVLHEHNCPISRVAERFPQACRCELELFGQLLGTRVERTECISEGGRKCTYRIYETD